MAWGFRNLYGTRTSFCLWCAQFAVFFSAKYEFSVEYLTCSSDCEVRVFSKKHLASIFLKFLWEFANVWSLRVRHAWRKSENMGQSKPRVHRLLFVKAMSPECISFLQKSLYSSTFSQSKIFLFMSEQCCEIFENIFFLRQAQKIQVRRSMASLALDLALFMPSFDSYLA